MFTRKNKKVAAPSPENLAAVASELHGPPCRELQDGDGKHIGNKPLTTTVRAHASLPLPLRRAAPAEERGREAGEANGSSPSNEASGEDEREEEESYCLARKERVELVKLFSST